MASVFNAIYNQTKKSAQTLMDKANTAKTSTNTYTAPTAKTPTKTATGLNPISAGMAAAGSVMAPVVGGFVKDAMSQAKSYNPSNINTPVSTVQAPATGGSRDIAAEIIQMLTSGGSIDYAKLNSLANERDAKLSSNPSAYGQFEDTQTLINKYLPSAQYNEQLLTNNTQMQQQIADMQAQMAAQPEATSVDSVIELLTQLATQKSSYLNYDEASGRAADELNPLYNTASKQLAAGLNSDMEQRGIYNSPLASGIMTEKQGLLSNEQISAISERANQLVQNDQELTLQEKRLKSNTLSSLLSSLIGRETNIADLTGYYNGQETLDREKYNTDTDLAEGDLTGNYNGQETLASKTFNLQSETSRLNNALNAVSTVGTVTTQEQADLLGVPIGTSSWQAKEAAASRAQELQMFNKEMSYKSASLSIQRASSSASDLLAAFNKDMIIWEQTGKSPNTEAMAHYGIAPGTPWSADSSQTAQEKLEETNAELELIGAEEELNFQGRATNFMNTYGTSRNISEAALVIIDQAGDYTTASKIAKANKTALSQEGINLTSVDSVLKKYYSISELYSPPIVPTIPTNYYDK